MATVALGVVPMVQFFSHKFLLATIVEAIASKENFIELKLASAMKVAAFSSLEM